MAQSNLHIQYNPYQNSTAIFHRNWTNNLKICMEPQRPCNGTPLQYSCLENPMDGGAWWAAVHGVTKSQTRLSNFTFTFHFPALEKEMATHSSVLAWRIPETGEPGRLPSMGSHRVRHDWSNLAVAADSVILSEASQTWKEKYHMTPLICGIQKEMIQMNLTYKTKTNSQTWKMNILLLGEGTVRDFGKVMYILLCLK